MLNNRNVNREKMIPQQAKTPAGIYVHIPFCVKKCPYCDFFSTTKLSLLPAYTKALLKEISMAANAVSDVDTVYIGGGTPSIMPAVEILRLIESIQTRYRILPNSEITIEVNPSSVSYRKLCDLRSAGINRVNIGVQSFQDHNLKFLGRIHTAHQAADAVAAARQAGFDNIGLDLIYGLPHQAKRAWIKDLKTAAALSARHISCYMLTVEPRTPLFRDAKSGRYRQPADQTMRELFIAAVTFLEENGYMQYEISNFALNRRAHGITTPELSRHNLKYWTFAPYLGFGPSAHSFLGGTRWWNVSSVKRYIRRIGDGRLPVAAKEVPTENQQMIEAVYLGLRTTGGIDIEAFNNRFDVDFKKFFRKSVRMCAAEGLLVLSERQCALTRDGMLLLDAVAARFVSEIEFTI